MTIITSVSQAQLATRRQKLRRSRRLKVFRTLWQTLAIGTIASGVTWAIVQPGWVIRQSDRVAISGNEFLSTEAIRALLPIEYPQSLFRLKPQQIAIALESKAPIASATVSRQLFPPRLTIEVSERYPVAIALPPTNPSNSSPDSSTPPGLLDEQGVWMPMDSYSSLDRSFPLPTLKIVGALEQYRHHWSEVYQVLSRCSVKIWEIDWQNPRNIILKTELGIVHIGSYGSQFADQLNVLAQMRQLPERVNESEIAYIDLKNPVLPSIQMR